MKYKVIDLVSDYQEMETGTCDICFGTADVECGYLVLEDENGRTYDVYLTSWDWGDFDTISIPNVVEFSAWLQERDEPDWDEIKDSWYWVNELVNECFSEDEDVEDLELEE